jgi:HPt (histidine-containing phosphotransfer) domain-containing protein
VDNGAIALVASAIVAASAAGTQWLIIRSAELAQRQTELDRAATELSMRYLVSRQRELRIIERLIEEGDFEELRVIAHNLKGTGSAYGYSKITNYGTLMEQAAKERNVDEFLRHYGPFAVYVRSVPAPASVRDE